jgi:hypothetical protein
MNQNGGGGNPITAASQRRLLTEEEVQQFTTSLSNRSATANDHDVEESVSPLAASSLPSTLTPQTGTNSLIDHDEVLDNVDTDQCAICLGEFDDDEDDAMAILPCQHKFHTSCITPWLTERQSKCPLCKFDVLQHIREQAASVPATTETTPDPDSPDVFIPTTTSASLWDQLRRYHWTSIATHHHPDHTNRSPHLHLDGVMRMVEALSANDLSVDYDDDDDDDDNVNNVLDNSSHRQNGTGNFEMTEPRRILSLRTI